MYRCMDQARVLLECRCMRLGRLALKSLQHCCYSYSSRWYRQSLREAHIWRCWLSQFCCKLAWKRIRGWNWLLSSGFPNSNWRYPMWRKPYRCQYCWRLYRHIDYQFRTYGLSSRHQRLARSRTDCNDPQKVWWNGYSNRNCRSKTLGHIVFQGSSFDKTRIPS